MKSVLISIQPKWCELIADGKKTIEVRKTRPKLETPFKCYIYETKAYDTLFGKGKPKKLCVSGGRVIGEFVCDRVEQGHILWVKEQPEYYDKVEETTQLTYRQMFDYLGESGVGYFWHISDLVIYDKPRELSEFYVEGDCDCMNCKKCYWFDRGNGYNVENDCNLAYKCVELHKSFKPIIRPPQSWCYVEVE